ncbi:hypothetical protein BDY19DRAFT_1071719 [Irpex rosettiformis]|uniref:Uncharacterized protein n=1 Tax=Irpex rosettiformis TaxID=378272 RepID=A0ACB8U3Z8_9APHY|nr:hypothetical protein BDY19DRAFT_1071719 [Irpex rosettiformis]
MDDSFFEDNPLNDFLSGKGIEKYWRDRREILEIKGYTLRPCRVSYSDATRNLNTVGDSESRSTATPYNVSQPSEEHFALKHRPNMVVATRIADGQLVHIKRMMQNGEYSNEAKNIALLREELYRVDPANHCVPILEILEDELNKRYSLAVMPYMHDVDPSKFRSVQEVVDFVGQLLLGLDFLHQQFIAHCDCSLHNIVVDLVSTALPQSPGTPDIIDRIFRTSRQKRKPNVTTSAKYYFTDFGASLYMDPDRPSIEFGIQFLYWARDTDVPEYRDAVRESRGVAFKPFELDVFLVGNMIRRRILERYSNVDFLQRLVDKMTQDRQALRPSASEALLEWLAVLQRIPIRHRTHKLRLRVPGKLEKKANGNR